MSKPLPPKLTDAQLDKLPMSTILLGFGTEYGLDDDSVTSVVEELRAYRKRDADLRKILADYAYATRCAECGQMWCGRQADVMEGVWPERRECEAALLARFGLEVRDGE